MTKRNLSQGEFDKNLINLFNSAEKIINKKVENPLMYVKILLIVMMKKVMKQIIIVKL